jgi:S-adenosylmethionine decarboxylase proenzyme
MSCTLAAFAVGRTARMILLVQPGLAFLQQHAQEQQQQQQHALSTPSDQDRRSKGMKLPNPSLKDGKVPPSTLYTSKNFDTALSATIHSRWVVSEGVSSSSSPEACSSSDSSVECTSCTRGNDASRIAVESDVHHDIEGEIHLPAGQHLLMDIRKVDYDFLASEERLALAMLEVVGECGLTLLSYHCHGLHPIGVSCVGVLLESHVSFHTWPVEGVITLDLFTCGPNSLLPIVPTVERLFSVPRTGATSLIDMPETIWAYKLRGFGENSQESKAALTDLFTFPIGAMTEYKKEVRKVVLGLRLDCA